MHKIKIKKQQSGVLITRKLEKTEHINTVELDILKKNEIPPLVPPQQTLEIQKALYERGVYVNATLPPACAPGECLLRCSLMATHTRALIDEATDIIVDVMQTYEREHGQE